MVNSAITDVTEYIESQFEVLDRGIVATPETRENLDAFAKSNQGSMDYLLTQMAVNYGYKIAMQNVLETLKDNSNE